MGSDEFVGKIRQEIAAQQQRADSQRDEKLHDAKVISNRGIELWGALNRVAVRRVDEVGTIAYTLLSDRQFALSYGSEVLKVSFDAGNGTIAYAGPQGKVNSFAPRVSGEDLVYYWGESAPISIEELADQIISILVERR